MQSFLSCMYGSTLAWHVPSAGLMVFEQAIRSFPSMKETTGSFGRNTILVHLSCSTRLGPFVDYNVNRRSLLEYSFSTGATPAPKVQHSQQSSLKMMALKMQL
ncbi:uncharacterized protein LOC104582545 [Brachypodium distachyon]|uniref:Uncharacterized protein n=1 Tax=Brachypodium distachyon TaxID=15368 RepID=A0A2K2D7T7_BRADI|nr:uncharacterized protein LOC104582545 [Brachypodium distachyon]PNT70340.1 hypothetical protein BRADI_2g10560v3 [Brachypodium distachyon]|eukprot:XP_024315747.1 uncharacterized protein LOC104582545 [Brachypodium distachyon]